MSFPVFLGVIAAFLLVASRAAAQTAFPQPVILDANNIVVGYPLGPGTALVPVGGQLIRFDSVTMMGFSGGQKVAVQYFHVAADCSDQRYLDASGLPAYGYSIGTTLVYPAMRAQTMQIFSYETFSFADDHVSLKKTCTTVNASVYVAPVATVSSTNFVPPFTIQLR